jgi:translation initiation factor IF-3
MREFLNLLKEKVLINESIKSPELRVVGSEGENVGVVSHTEAMKLAREAELDLIVISPKAKPPVAKIMDYGKFQYDQKKKQREVKKKAHVTETKVIQIKIGTGEHDLALKQKRIEEWLEEGHRIKLDLFLKGRYKYMEFDFLKGKMEEFLKRIEYPFKVADPIKKSPKGLSCTLERDGKGKPKAKSTDTPEVKLPEPKEPEVTSSKMGGTGKVSAVNPDKKKKDENK